MILSHTKFDFKNRSLIEKVVVKAPFRFQLDFPNDACFIHFREGSTVVNAPFEQVAVSSKDSVLLKCGRYFSNLTPQPDSDRYEVVVIHLSKVILQEIYHHDFPPLRKKDPTEVFIQKIDEQALINEFIKGLEFYCDHPRLVNDDLLELKIKELILLLLQTKNSSSVNSLFQEIFIPSHVNIREVVNSHLYSDLSVGDLAYLCNLSESTFKRRFKESYKDTPSNYIKRMRLERAKELLHLEGTSISEIAYQVGFKDVAHFSRSFKSAFGESPKEYRAKLG